MSQPATLGGGHLINEISNLNDELLKLLTEKEKDVIVKRYNLDNKGGSTLEQIGQEYSVTRERIRQIEKNALKKMQRHVSNSPLKEFHSFLDEIVSSKGGIIKKDHFDNSFIPKDLSAIDRGHVNLNIDIHSDVESKGNTISYYPHIKQKGHSDALIKDISKKIIQKLKKHGDTKEVSKLEKYLRSTLSKTNLNRKTIESIVAIDKRLTMVGTKRIGLTKWRHVCPKTLKDKIIYVLTKHKKTAHFSKIKELIEQEKFDDKLVNLQAVHNELIRCEDFVLIGRGIYAMKSWGYEEGTVSEVISRILKSHPQGMEQDQIIEEVLKRREVKQITIKLALKNNEKFERIGRKIYKLKSE